MLENPPVLQTVTDFGQRLRAPVIESRVGRGLGGIARFAAEQAFAAWLEELVRD